MARLVFTVVATLLLLCSGVVHAAVSFTNDEYNVIAGQPFTLKWEGANAPVTITLMNGPDVDLQEVMVIDSNDYGTSFTWTPPYTLAVGTYEFRINDGSSEDYSARFSYPGTPRSSTVLSTSPTSTSPPGTVTSTSTSTTPASPTDTDGAPPAESGAADAPGTLSTNAKIGIGVGSGIGAVVLLGLLALFVYRRGRRAGLREGGAGHEDEMDNNDESKWEAQPKLGPPAFGEQSVAHEVSGQSHVAEIGSSEWHGYHHRMTPAELAAEPYHAR